jgi:DNA-binding CsgD family transcriptional regulator
MRSTNNDRLTDGQIACLSLVAQNLTSKEIAVRLGISPHTVDQRVRKALRKLDTPNRRHAARLIKAKHRQWLGDARSPSCVIPPPMRTPTQTDELFGNLPLPFATAARPQNMLPVWQRLLWIVAIAVAATFACFIYLAGLESLSRLLRH